MNGIPLIETNDPRLIARGYNLGLKLVPNLLQVLTPQQLEEYENNLHALQEVIRRGLITPAKAQAEMTEVSRLQLPDLSKTGDKFGDWLVAREQLHLFLTGEVVVLRDIFQITDDVLVRTDIMPFFRPVGASNRVAMDWKVRLGMNPSYEEVDVMKYRNSEGPKVPELYYINRSVTPDQDTLGKNAKSPDQLIGIKEVWTSLYGWSDADNLHFLITGTHLDSGDTSSWFPNDRLPGVGRVAYGYWSLSNGQAKFFWNNRGRVRPDVGARLARGLPLKPKT